MTLQLLGLTPVQIIANPAVTIGRAFTDTYAGISPASVTGFVVAQLIGLLTALGLIAVFYPTRMPAVSEQMSIVESEMKVPADAR